MKNVEKKKMTKLHLLQRNLLVNERLFRLLKISLKKKILQKKKDRFLDTSFHRE